MSDEDKAGSSDWVSQFLIKIAEAKNGILEVEVGGVKIVAALGDDLKDFFLENKSLLTRIGKNTFIDFLTLINQKKDQEAFMILLAKMNADELISRMEGNADALHDYTKNKETFIAKLEGFLLTASLRLASKALLALLL